MPKKESVNKTQVVRDYMKVHPGAGNTEVSQALAKQNVKLSPQHVANIKSKIKAKRTARKAAAKVATAGAPAPVTASTPPVAEPPTKATNAITLEQIKKVAQTVKTIGGFDRLRELLDVVRDVGGLKKFKDLLDAMSVTGTDAVPY